MTIPSAPSQELLSAAAAMESALIRRLTDGDTLAVRVRAPADLDTDPACLAAAAFANLSDLLTVLPHAQGAVDLPPKVLSALGAKAIAGAAYAAGLNPGAITLELEEAALANLGDDALTLAERLKTRGFRLRLNCTPEAPLGLSQRARDLFSSAQTSAAAALAAPAGQESLWTNPMARRLAAAKAAGLELVADGAEPGQAGDLAKLGFTALSYAEAA